MWAGAIAPQRQIFDLIARELMGVEIRRVGFERIRPADGLM
jgi:hypothetical protein